MCVTYGDDTQAQEQRYCTGPRLSSDTRFRPEWAKHSGTWFSWPRPEGISFPDKYHTVPENLARIFAEIAQRETVHVNVPNENYKFLVSEQLTGHGCPLKNIRFHFIPTNENWCRDHGPAVVVNAKGRAAIVDWGFNAWGGKYPPYDSDDAVPTRVAEHLGLPVFYPGVGTRTGPVVMEGGAIDVNGAGTLPDHHGLPAEQEPESRVVQGGDRDGI